MNWNEYTLGVRRGMPVGMGYLSVSFGFGTLAASQGIRVLDAFLISATNVTSAGQFAGLTLILAGAGLWEVWPGAGPWWCLAWPRASIRPASRAL